MRKAKLYEQREAARTRYIEARARLRLQLELGIDLEEEDPLRAEIVAQKLDNPLCRELFEMPI